MSVQKQGVTLGRIEPAKRFYQTRRMARSEAGILTIRLGQNLRSDWRVSIRMGPYDASLL